MNLIAKFRTEEEKEETKRVNDEAKARLDKFMADNMARWNAMTPEEQAAEKKATEIDADADGGMWVR